MVTQCKPGLNSNLLLLQFQGRDTGKYSKIAFMQPFSNFPTTFNTSFKQLSYEVKRWVTVAYYNDFFCTGKLLKRF